MPIKMAATILGRGRFQMRELTEFAGLLEKAQKGQRIARGLALDDQTEEQARAEARAENRSSIDALIDAIKKYVPDPAARDLIREAILTFCARRRSESARMGATHHRLSPSAHWTDWDRFSSIHHLNRAHDQ